VGFPSTPSKGNFMAFAATLSTKEVRKVALGGPLKAEIFTWTAISGDTSGTVTSTNLHTIYHCIIDGVVLTAAPTFSSNVATLAFANPAATVFGTLILIGV
jgi:hypothetical protein